MRRHSRKFQDRKEAVEEWRDALRLRVSRCEYCHEPACPSNLDVHELVVSGLRQKALDKPYATLCVTRLCHNKIETLTIPEQLAYLLLSRPEDYDLPAYHRLTGRCWPDHETIETYAAKLEAQRQYASPHHASPSRRYRHRPRS